MNRPMIFLAILCLWSGSLLAQDANRMMFSGEFGSDQRLLLDEKNTWAWNENRLDLRLDIRSEKLRFYANIWLRHLGDPLIQGAPVLYSKDLADPWNLDIREAYVEVRGFLTDRLDMKAGRQRIAWGSADRFNPTDILNAYDLEDILDFGRKNASDALSLTWYFQGNTSLQGVLISRFRPANLPLGVFSGVLAADESALPDVPIGAYSEHVVLPERNFRESVSAGLRLKGFVLNTDVSVSYVYGRYSLPFLTQLWFTPGVSEQGMQLDAFLSFPRFHMMGADLAGQLGRVGIWAEAGVFVPQEEILQLASLMGGCPTPITRVLLEKKPYLHLVVGADYTFAKGTYLNLQYLYGFMGEHGVGNQHDYLMLAIERSLMQDRLLLRPLGGGFSVSDRSDIKNNYGLIYAPEVIYRGIDNLELGMGAYFFGGKGNHFFTRLKGMDMITASLKVSF